LDRKENLFFIVPKVSHFWYNEMTERLLLLYV